MINVKLKGLNKDISCEYGENLLDVARNNDIFIDAPCNGNISCGKCKVKLISGKVNTQKTLHIKDEEWEQGYILACNTNIIQDIEIELPDKLTSSMHHMKIEGSNKEKDKEIFDRAINIAKNENIAFQSKILKAYMELDEPTIDDNISDIDRIERHIRNNLGYDEIDIKLSTIRNLPQILRENKFKITITYTILENKFKIINIETGNTQNSLYGVCIDIGTTSVVACLVDLKNTQVIDKSSSANAQIKYGADVIHRIIYSSKKDGLEVLRKAIVEETINHLLQQLYTNNNISKNDVVSAVIAGNTTMSSLFLGVYTDYLRQEPFIPAFLKSPNMTGEETGLCVNSSCEVFLAPNVASYVGGDITAGVLSAGIWATDENVLFIDLGTNGEIVFGNRDYMMSCACSAGPAFEGGGISCGMRASNGAIEKVDIDCDTLKPTLSVIANEKPVGICGSGIIDLICKMLINKIIDRRGKLYRDLNNERIRFNEYDMGEYVLAFKEEYDLENDLTINEVDIDNFIKAKGAIFSGATVLIESLGMDYSMIDKVYIAGGIGNSLNIENAILIGLLPDIERNKFEYIGNSSLVGGYLALVSDDAKEKLKNIGQEMTYVELSVYPSYMDEFISACFLPHTNIEQFPSTKEILEGQII